MLQSLYNYLEQNNIKPVFLGNQLISLTSDDYPNYQVTAEIGYQSIEFIIKKDLYSYYYNGFTEISEKAVHLAVSQVLYGLNKQHIAVDCCCGVLSISLYYKKSDQDYGKSFDKFLESVFIVVKTLNDCMGHFIEDYRSKLAKVEYDPNHWLFTQPQVKPV